MAPSKPPGIYKSAEGEALIRDWYTRFQARLKYSVETRQLETDLGQTQVLVSGPEDAPPVLCLHGALAGAPHMLGELGDLPAHFRLYAVDIVGQSVASAQLRPNPHDDSYARWLTQVLDALGLNQPLVLAVSWGASVALKLARYRPERLRGLVLLTPAALVQGPVLKGLMQIGLPMLAFRLAPTEARRDWAYSALLTTPDPLWSPFLVDSMTHTKMDFSAPPLIQTGDLAGLRAPVYIFAGDQDLSFPGEALLKRAQQVFPHYQGGELLSDCKHVPPFTKAFRQRWTAQVREIFTRQLYLQNN
ncbi:MAG: alpha/beta fold hydrolase [Candidatus Sericytochromatia bacterium]